MESDSGISAKKRRLQSTDNTPQNVMVAECIREFKLPQTFPSMAKNRQTLNGNIMMKKIVLPISSISTGTSQKTNKVYPGAKVTKNLRKLKLKSPDGRDLGEFNVHILPQGNNLTKNSSASLTIKSPLEYNNKLINVKSDKDGLKSGMPIVKISPSKMIGVVNPLSSVKHPTNSNQTVKLEDKKKTTHGVLIPINPVIQTNPIVKQQSQLQTVNDHSKNNKMFVVKSLNNWQIVKFNDKKKIDTQTSNSTPVMVKFPCDNGIGVNKIKISPTNKTNIKNIVLQKSPMFRAVQNSPLKISKLMNNESNGLTQLTISKPNDVSTAKIITKKESQDVLSKKPIVNDKMPVNSMNNSDSNATKIENVNKNDNVNSKNNVNAILSPTKDNDTSECEKKNIEKTNDVNSQRSYPLRNSHGTVNLIRRGKRSLDKISKPCDNVNNPSLNDSSIDKCKDNSSNDKLSNLSIVSQALSMIDDSELRTKALQALADCGIGIECLVPAKPPNQQLSIKQSQTQTCVFGLLDQENFVRVTGDTDNIIRLQETERHNIGNNTKKPNKYIQETQKITEKLNELFDQRWANKVGVEKINEMLKISPIAGKVYSLMEKDFKNATKCDKDGFLGIHRAILSNRLHTVKRQLMVLRGCKRSIDIPTSCGQTGLELAIRNAVSPEIITLLLEYKANPTSRESGHDSALTIAANASPQYLLQLIKHVSKSGDLNNVDSQGSTALHYCVFNRNIDGLMALIEANADVNVRDLKSGRTPLFHAMENEYLDIVKILLKNGARGNIPTFSGHTVMVLLDEDKHYSVKEALHRSMK